MNRPNKEPEIEETPISENAKRAKADIDDWNKILLKRRDAYWDHYKNKEASNIFEKESKEETPKMPRKFQTKKIENEPDDEYAIRKEAAIHKLNTHIKLLQLRAKKKENIYATIDKEMNELISEKNADDDDLKTELLTYWTMECKREEKISARIFQRRREWILENITNEDRDGRTKNNTECEREDNDETRTTTQQDNINTNKGYPVRQNIHYSNNSRKNNYNDRMANNQNYPARNRRNNRFLGRGHRKNRFE